MKEQLNQLCLMACVRMRAERLQNFSPFPADQCASRKITISEQGAFCVLQFGKTESTINMQRAFRIKLSCQQRYSPNLNFFCTISRRKVYGPFVIGKPTNFGAYLDVLQL
ncbi:hypothetical protein TNCV_3146771 [Trichonephila clavipes]|nr:hypothetical protein TNCV_3146771 [Trichonephila clavipes]